VAYEALIKYFQKMGVERTITEILVFNNPLMEGRCYLDAFDFKFGRAFFNPVMAFWRSGPQTISLPISES